MSDEKLDRVYQAETLDQQEAAYDAWANDYERDLCNMGYRIPGIVSAAFARFVTPGSGMVLDAGCGGGIQTEALAAMGYGPITGIDLSLGMLDVAKAKGIYAHLKQQTIGERLDFEDGTFAACLTTGTFTPGHAPPHGFDELFRIIRPGGHLVMVLRSDDDMPPEYQQRLDDIEESGAARLIMRGEGIPCMPYTEPSIIARAQVYEVLS